MATTTSPQIRKGQKSFSIDEASLKKLVKDFFLILNDTEKTVIERRFQLSNIQSKQTLDTIGKHFDLTRERIRQIEANAIKKLQRNITNSHIWKIAEQARSILQENGKILSHDELVSKTLKALHTETPYSGNVVMFALRLDEKIKHVKAGKDFDAFYFLAPLTFDDIEIASKAIRSFLKKEKKVTSFAAIYQKINSEINLSKQELEALSKVSTHLLEPESGSVGLAKWRNINPKSIKDKAILIFEKEKKPLHFIDLANKISEFGDKKTVTTQAVHNDLIRYNDFVLVGRGMYGLIKWGIPAGTVKDIIAKILKEHGPISRKEIIERVSEYREVKLNTISLNLQKCPAFVRVGRAVYDFDESKWEEPESNRGRGGHTGI
jgi:DNA-directed RNA polymerase delta subunit